jgi:hypothetical protein
MRTSQAHFAGRRGNYSTSGAVAPPPALGLRPPRGAHLNDSKPSASGFPASNTIAAACARSGRPPVPRPQLILALDLHPTVRTFGLVIASNFSASLSSGGSAIVPVRGFRCPGLLPDNQLFEHIAVPHRQHRTVRALPGRIQRQCGYPPCREPRSACHRTKAAQIVSPLKSAKSTDARNNPSHDAVKNGESSPCSATRWARRGSARRE